MYGADTVMYFSTSDSQVIADAWTNELALISKWLIDNNLFMRFRSLTVPIKAELVTKCGE